MSVRDGGQPASPAELATLWRWGLRARSRAWERAVALAAVAAVLAFGSSRAVDALRSALGAAVVGEPVAADLGVARVAAAIVAVAVVFVAAAVIGTGLSRNLGPAQTRGRADRVRGPRELNSVEAALVATAAVAGFVGLGVGLVASAARAVDASESGLVVLARGWAWRLALGGGLVLAVAGAWQRIAARRALAQLGPWLRRQSPAARRR